MVIGIYRIISPSHKIYIGQSWDIARRLKSYRNLNCKNQRKLYHSLSKYGFENHKFEVLYEFKNIPQQIELNNLEKYYLSIYRATSFELLNLNDSESRGKISEETRKKMSDAAKKITNRPKGFMISAETRKKLSIAATGKKGNQPTKERLEKMSKPIYQLSLDGFLIKEYPSIAEAAKQTGFYASNISYCASGKFTQSGGYKWQFKPAAVEEKK